MDVLDVAIITEKYKVISVHKTASEASCRSGRRRVFFFFSSFFFFSFSFFLISIITLALLELLLIVEFAQKSGLGNFIFQK
jgi:hypothetical protein